MAEFIDDSRDANVPEQAVQALKNAQLRAQKSGRTQVLVADGKLIRITNGQVTVLKDLPRRKKVTRRSERDAS